MVIHMASAPSVVPPCQPESFGHVGRWRIREQVGRGSGTVVYRVSDGRGRSAALKTCEPTATKWAQGSLARRLQHEAAALRLIGGCGVVRLWEDGSHADWPHLVLELLDGPTLAALVARRGGLRADRVARLGALLAHTIAALHATGVTHGDLKPANVVCLDDGPVLIDLDAATLSRPRSLELSLMPSPLGSGVGRTTSPAAIASSCDGGDTIDMRVRATPAWIAPEVAEGEEAGPPADVFGLGAVLANASSGRAPFGTGPVAVVLERVRTQGPDLDGVAPALRPLLRAALARRPEHRPTADEFGITLRTGGLHRLAA